jgi:TolB-like protein/tetratricopeptide (TPR) repeat protein
VDRALSPDPARRPATAGALEGELAASLELLHETPATIAAPVPPRGIRYALMGAAGLLLVVVALWTSGVGTTLVHRSGQPRVRSLAVLPLRNVAGEQDYFSAGMTDLLTTNLSKVKALKVISASSVRDYEQAHLPSRDIAATLNVDAILRWTVFRDGNRLRVTAQLVSAADQSSLWAETYERDVRDAFTLQGDLARDIANGINLSLTPKEQSDLTAAATGSRNPQAQDEYLKGWTALEPRTPQALAVAIDHFKEAVRLDPTYAQGYSSLAFAYFIQSGTGNLPSDEAYALVRQAALRAIDLDANQASAYYSLGRVQFYHDWDWTAAASSLQHALDLDPNNAEAHATYGEFLTAQGRFDDALVEMKHARELDPMSHIHRSDLAMVYFYQRRFREADALIQEILSISTNVGVAKFMLGRQYADEGRLDEALALYAAPDAPHGVRNQCEWARVLAVAGREGEAREKLGKIEANEESQRTPDALAFVYLALGDRERALQLLEHAVATRVPSCIWLKVDPRFASLHGEARFSALLRQIGFPGEGS